MNATTPPERWNRVKQLTADALERPEFERAAWLAEACAGDEALWREVSSLLKAHADAGGFLETPGLAEAGAAQAVAATALRAATPIVAGRSIGPYRVIRELGHGGMGVVYLAERADAAFEKNVAIKVVRGGFASGSSMTRRFHEERRILATLDHPNIARLLDAGTLEDGLPYLVMEYVDGIPLDAHCEAIPLSVAQRLLLFGQVCAAVQFAHQRLVIHRDLKARNILVTPDGTPKLLDFGIAKLLEPGLAPDQETRTGLRPLTLEGASPEQVRGEPMTVASDVYALGVLLYRLLAGQSPYGPRELSEADLMRAICEVEPARPSAAAPRERRRVLRGELDWVVLKALRKEPDRRYASVEQLADDLGRHLTGRPVIAAPDSWRYRARKFAVRHWVGLGAAAVVALALALGGAATVWQARRAERRFNDVRKLAKTFMFDVHDAIAKLPGSTAARKLLVTEALQYLDSLALEARGDASLQRELATGYHKMGDVLGWPSTPNLGDVPGALKAYGKAQAAQEQLLADDPSNADLLRDLSTTSQRISRALFWAGDPRAGAEQARKATLIEERLSALDRGSGQRFRLARSYANHGFMLFVSRRTVDSLKRLREAVTILEQLDASSSTSAEVKGRLAVTYGYIASALWEGEPVPGVAPDLRAALEMQRKAAVLEASLSAAAPSDLGLQRQVWVGIMQLGQLLEESGDRTAAREQYRQGLARAGQLARADAANVQAQKDLAFATMRMGVLLARDGAPDEALVLLGRAAKLFEPVLAADPTNVNTRSMLAGNTEGFAHAHAALGSDRKLARNARLGHWSEAKARFQAAYAHWKELRDKGAAGGADAAKPVALALEIAKCDAALGGGPAVSTPKP